LHPKRLPNSVPHQFANGINNRDGILDIEDYLFRKQDEDDHPYLDKLKDAVPYLQAILDKEKISNYIRVVFKKTEDVL
jgi:hypothetical protein